jgi:hypothetical protein
MSEFNIKNLDTAPLSDQGIKRFLRHPKTNEQLPLFVVIKGADSDAYQRVSDASLNSVFDQIAKTGKVQRSAVDVREEKVKSTCAMITEWGGGFEGEDITDPAQFTAAKEKFFGWRGYAWALDQVNFLILDRTNFLPE